MEIWPTIIPIAPGKGGVGKSWFAANLALALADLGADTIALDLDLGGSNLHTFLGMPNKYAGVGDYLKGKGRELLDMAVPTPFPNLRFIAGDGQSLFMGNIPHARKLKLIRAIRRLDADFVIVDLSAGSAFNNLDFFAIAPNGITVTTPELPAMLNLMTFTKNLVFRMIENEVRRCHPLHRIVKQRYVQGIEDDPVMVEDLLIEMMERYPAFEQKTREAVATVHPRLVINMGVGPEDLSYLKKIESQLARRLSISFDHFGFIPRDATVYGSIQNHQVYLKTHGETLPSVAIRAIADRVRRLWERRIDRSWERLFANTHRLLGTAQEQVH